jgi:hypothetical protein
VARSGQSERAGRRRALAMVGTGDLGGPAPAGPDTTSSGRAGVENSGKVGVASSGRVGTCELGVGSSDRAGCRTGPASSGWAGRMAGAVDTSPTYL